MIGMAYDIGSPKKVQEKSRELKIRKWRERRDHAKA
jgi:hypothetical protein